MLNIWKTEAPALLAAAFALILLGLISNNWLFASLVTSGLYIAWLYQRLLKLEQWIRNGTRVQEAYKDNGFIGVIIRQLYFQKKNHNKRKRRIKKILRRLHQNIAALPDAAVLLNDKLRIDWCNDPASYLLDLRSPQDLGNKIHHIIRDPGLRYFLENHTEQQTLELLSPVDPEITLQIKKVSFGDKQILLIARNISDQKQLQQSLKNFIAYASHELRSPLTVICGHLELLEAENNMTESGHNSVKTAQHRADRMKELLQDLLLLSQVESYQLAIDEGDNIAIADLKTSLLESIDLSHESDRIQLDFPAQLYLLGIKVEIEGICINLIENALKYSIPGKTIQANWCVNSESEFVFSVRDQGPGIEPEEISKLTNRYYRGQNSHLDTKGSGLGLAIVKHAAKKHGARLKIASEPGIGSCFSVTFPSYRCLRT